MAPSGHVYDLDTVNTETTVVWRFSDPNVQPAAAIAAHPVMQLLAQGSKAIRRYDSQYPTFYAGIIPPLQRSVERKH